MHPGNWSTAGRKQWVEMDSPLAFLANGKKRKKNTMCTESKIFWLAANEGSLFESVKNATLELKTVNFIIFDQFNQCILD